MMAESGDAYILGDIDVFLRALWDEHRTMQAQYAKEEARAQAWIRHEPLTAMPDASED